MWFYGRVHRLGCSRDTETQARLEWGKAVEGGGGAGHWSMILLVELVGSWLKLACQPGR